MLRFAYAGESRSDKRSVVNEDGREDQESGRESFDELDDSSGSSTLGESDGALRAACECSRCVILPKPRLS